MSCNRQRLSDEEQLAVEFKDYPDADKYADDFFMGWLVAASESDRKKIRDELKQRGRDPGQFTFKRDSVLRMNMAVALEPYRHDSVFTQSPLNAGKSPWKNAESSQLLHRETTVTAYQYPFALNLEECRGKEDWTRKLLHAIGELNDVAGNHARSYYEFAPASIVVRLTGRLVAGFDTYGFRVAENGQHELPEVIDGILHDDYPESEFYLGGKIVREMEEEKEREEEKQKKKQGNNPPPPQATQGGAPPESSVYTKLENKGVKLFRTAQKLLEQVGKDAFQGP
ncbi:MAG: type I-B CRISPR-associated protein Cas7/Cst2/DevR [Candidatus Latescibacteria bacterium]|nr:type I-B CRISPR-associated protein Cas7/Cst2/DevR [Candidatus Latescibacterota bacterium]